VSALTLELELVKSTVQNGFEGSGDELFLLVYTACLALPWCLARVSGEIQFFDPDGIV
jgi:hypothetical protein